ncbi:MAG: energy-coupled thiamine transporter ThiT [Clostridiales bacterium]|nr:energy-coupled thiamine transporter ThiT [Clostridiales bacterium]
MFMSIVTADGGLTTLGYAICVIAVIALVLVAGFLREKAGSAKKMSTKQLVFCAMAMALAFITSYIRLFNLPYGGSVTLFSMLFICLIGNWYGVKVGIMTGLAYGILQFLQEPYVLSFFQVCCDYVLAFAGLGLAGIFCRSKNGLVKGYLLGIFVRGAFHSLGGYLYWMDYMPENFPQALASLYPIIYNYSYILLEGIITVVVISLPPVAKALQVVKRTAVKE